MARAARSVHARKKRRKVLEQAKGYRGTKHSSYKRAKEQVWKSGVYAYQGRKQRKRDFRSLWIQRINAGAREHGMSYSQLIHGLRLAEIDLDRKILADLAATEPEIFAGVVTQAKNAMSGNPVESRVKVERAPEPEPAPKPQTRREPAAEVPAAQPASEPEAAPVAEATDADEQLEVDVEVAEAAERHADEPEVDIESIEGGSRVEDRVLVEDVKEAAEEEGKDHATDAAERKAEELGVDLSALEGTGQEGRITVGDVEKAAKDGEDG